MKCTLRKVEQGIVATINEEMKVGDYRYCITRGYYRKVVQIDLKYANKHKSFHKIIASNFGVGMELDVYYNAYSKATKDEVLESMVGLECSYSIVDNKVIINL